MEKITSNIKHAQNNFIKISIQKSSNKQIKKSQMNNIN
jgi:hypothetical protein